MSSAPGSQETRTSATPPRGPMMRHGVRIQKAKDPRGALIRLADYLKPHRALLVLAFVLIVVSTGLSVTAPYLVGRAIDAVADPSAFRRTMGLLLAVYLLSWLAQAIDGVLLAHIVHSSLRNLRRDLFAHLQVLSLRYFDSRPQGDLMSRLTNDVDAISRALSMNISQVVSSTLSIIGILIAMFVLNTWLALGSLTVIPLMFLFTAAVASRTRAGFRQLQAELGQFNGQIEETIAGQRVVQAFGRESSTLAAFDKLNEAVRETGIRAMVFAMMIPPMMAVFSNSGIAVVAGLGGYLVLRGMASVGTIVSFITYSRRFVQPLRQLGDMYNSIQAALAGAERVFEVLDEEPDLVNAPDALPLKDIQGDVVFDHVEFHYKEGVPVLHDVSLHARPGEVIALVGPTGAGKTTIVNLLTRFYDIESGSILIDGQDIRHVNKEDLRRQLGIVLQDMFLFSDTVMENIRYGRLDATDEECIEAARLANADQFIRRLPDGYNTLLSERGSNLSQGQRQLLSIARAVLTDPRILILDEATSSVDTRTERRIQQALLRLMQGRTSFVIAHRLSTIRNADQVLVINDGRIVERGTHEELLALRGFYYNLYMSQFKGTRTAEEELEQLPEKARPAGGSE